MSVAEYSGACLFIVATPIGNLGDMSPRAVDVLSHCDLIAAEDTRHSGALLKHFAVQTPTVSFHDFSTAPQLQKLLDRLQAGQQIAVISDAGTPTIADPGFALVRGARQLGIDVVPIPGASAMLAALSVSGLPTDRFRFVGFPPPRAGAREEFLQELKNQSCTQILYESPHRIQETLEQMEAVLGGDRLLFVARELTKKFETTFLAPIADCRQRIAADPQQQKGEFVLILAAHEQSDENSRCLQEGLRVLRLLLIELPLKQAVSLAAQISGAPRNQLYSLALQEKS